MFILQRQEVKISSVPHPKHKQPVTILTYQGQPFRLLYTFPLEQEAKAKALWRDLADNKGKLCVLLAESHRYSVWGKVRSKSSVSRLKASRSNRPHP